MGSHCFSFFFQAEDGIRDVAVTGVQTCALPIWLDPGRVAPTDLVAGPIDRLDVSPGRVGVEGEAFDIGADGSERDLLDLSAGEGRQARRPWLLLRLRRLRRGGGGGFSPPPRRPPPPAPHTPPHPNRPP